MIRPDNSDANAYYAVGAGGSITGAGADLLLIDGPIKGREDANSETYRRQLRFQPRALAQPLPATRRSSVLPLEPSNSRAPRDALTTADLETFKQCS